jgi:thiol-disulfide isomerase/thioredoxin
MAASQQSGTCINTTDKGGNPMLWGLCHPTSFQAKPYSLWYNPQYKNYAADSISCSSIAKTNFKMAIYMGTWCGDSKREVPRMYKIIDQCGVKPENVKLYTVNNSDGFYKQTLGMESALDRVFRVPTFIIYEPGGAEVGRIIESPVQSLEKDVLNILTGNNYTPKYHSSNQLLQFCLKTGKREFSANIRSEIEKFKDSSYFSYAVANLVMILMAGGSADRAGVLADANEAVFPNDIYAMLGKARFLRYIGNKTEAAEYCRKILLKDPENATAKEINTSLTL